MVSNPLNENGARTEQEILASELSYRRLFEAAQDGILILDAETGRIDDVNPYLFNLLGFSRDEMVGKTVAEVSPFKDIESNQAMLERLQEQGYVRYENLPLETRDGRKKAVEFVSNVYQAGDRKVIQCNIRDITERKAIEAQLMRAQRMESIGTLASGIAHDLNNILSPMVMSIDVLKNMSDNPQARKILDTLEVNAKRGAEVVREILSLASGLEAEGISGQPKQLLEGLEKVIKNTFPRDLHLQFSIPTDTWTTLGEATQVHDILLGLCVNVQEAHSDGTSLTISVENDALDEQHGALRLQAKVGRHVTIKITNVGPGVQPRIPDKIFLPYFTTSEPMKDSTNFVDLPRGNGETILVVEDEASILTLTSQMLQAYGYRTLTAKDGTEAVGIYVQHRNEIAVVLTDMMMPVMDGPTMIRVLRKFKPMVKVVASSGVHANAKVAQSVGVTHFLPKPYSPKALLTVMRAILDEVY